MSTKGLSARPGSGILGNVLMHDKLRLGAVVLVLCLGLSVAVWFDREDSSAKIAVEESEPPSTPRRLDPGASVSTGLELSVAATAESVDGESLAELALKRKQTADVASDLVVDYGDRPQVASAGSYEPKEDIVTLEICEWIGYGGLILANRGLEPKEDSFFFEKYGFKLHIIFNETEEWDGPNRGSVAASVATVDTAAVYGTELSMICPLVFGFAHFDEGIVVKSNIKSIRDARGQTFIVPHFTQGELIVRTLARGEGLPVVVRRGFEAPEDGDAINLVYAAGVDDAALIFTEDLISGRDRLIGFAGWEPYATEIVQRFRDQVAYLQQDKPFVGADIQLFNRGFMKKYPQMVKGMIHGTLVGNDRINQIKNGRRDDEALEILAEALTTDSNDPWTSDYVREQLNIFAFSNYSINLGFLIGAMERGSSFGKLYEQACEAYGFAFKEEEVDWFVGPETVDLIRSLGEEEPFRKNRFRLQSAGDLAKASPGTIDWAAFNFKFSPRVYDAFDVQAHIEELEALSLFLESNPETVITLTGALKRPPREEGNQEEPAASRARSASLLRARTVRRYLLNHLGVAKANVNIDGIGWHDGDAGVSVTCHQSPLE